MPRDKAFLRPQRRSYMQRRVDELPIRQRFLIVCEGEKTEPNYFGRFRVPRKTIRVEGLGMNTMSLVQEALAILTEDGAEYDQTWCVFDKDDFPHDNFNNAIAFARKNGIKVAYSNQCFELWYVLHFCYMQNAITRDDYKKILDRELGHKYEKNSSTIYDELNHLQAFAIENAKKLLDQYDSHSPAREDPSTTVHLLVEELIKSANPFRRPER